MNDSSATSDTGRIDLPTLIALAALAYVSSTAVHEHLGHGAACVWLGSRPLELGAFYVACDNPRLGSAALRGVAAAGPLVSLLQGALAYLLLWRWRGAAASGWYFTWLVGTLGLMTATGYLIFSGFGGIGDLGFEPDSLFYGAQPQWLLRLLMLLAGAGLYLLVIRVAQRALGQRIDGQRDARQRLARHVCLVAYVAGAVVVLLIGVLNPHGLVIVVSSALASSMGGTVGLVASVWRLEGNSIATQPALAVPRSPAWIAAATVLVALYAWQFGPTWYLAAS